MKKLFSYSLILMVLCALVSCSNDDDNNESGSEKNAKKLLYSSYDGGCNFIYDDKGKLEKVGIMTCIWTDNSVECASNSSDGNLTALLSGDKIIKESSMSIDYSGDRRTKIAIGPHETETYKWDGDNITESNYNDGYNYYRTTTYTYYLDKKGNGAIDAYIMINNNDLMYHYGSSTRHILVKLLLAHPWLIGKSNKNLIKSKTIHNNSGETETFNYTYEFDTNGNPINVYKNGRLDNSFLWE